MNAVEIKPPTLVMLNKYTAQNEKERREAN